MAAAHIACSRGRQPGPAVQTLIAALMIFLQLVSAAVEQTLFKDAQPLAMQLAATSGTSTLKVSQYALPKDVQVLTMPDPEGGVQPAVLEFKLDLEFLLTNPTAFTVNLPFVASPIVMKARRDLNSLLDSATAAAGGATPVPSQPPIINSAAVTLQSARLWTGEVDSADAGSSAVSFSASTDTWNVYGEIRYLEQQTNTWRLYKIVPALTASQVAAMNAAAGSGSTLLQPPPQDVSSLVFAYQRLPTTSTRQVDAVTAEAAPTAAAAPTTTQTDRRAGGTYDYKFREANPVAARDTISSSSSSSSSTSSSNDTGSTSRIMLQSAAADVARQDVLLLYNAAAAANSFTDEYVRASMVNVLAITNKAYLDSQVPVVLYAKDIRQVPWQDGPTPLQDVTDGSGGLGDVRAWRDEVSADLVSFWYSSTSQPSLCGEAWVGGGANFAYSAINMPCWSGYNFAGAVARNQGCRSNFHAAGFGTFATGMAGTYAYGLRRCGGARCSDIVTTILSNPCLCNKQQEPVGFFSNPSLKVRIRNTWQTLGMPTQADCARGIRETATAVSSYR